MRTYDETMQIADIFCVQDFQLNVGYMQVSAMWTDMHYQLPHGMKQLLLHKWVACH